MTNCMFCTRKLATVLCTVTLLPGNSVTYIASASPPMMQAPSPPTSQAQAQRISAVQLDSLVSPIALYPDPLLAQTLAASTYPLELLQLHQWLVKNPGLKDQALRDAVAKQPWDPSVQAMAGLPDVVKWLADDIQWTTDLGNAFLAQEGDVMDAVQRMRLKAQNAGNLKTTPQQKVEEQLVENKHVIVIEQANPQVIYVPSYNPEVVYGPAVYPYPSIYYPPAGYYAAGAAISFGVGVAMGAFWGGGWGWGAGWGHNNVTVNNFNNFNRNANINGGNRNIGNSWQHNAAHRGGTPYRDQATANRYGGTARADSLANRQAGARQQVARQGGNLRSNGAVGTSGVGGRTGANNLGGRNGLNNRAGAGAAGRPGAGGANRVGSRDLRRGPGGGSAARPNGGASSHPQSRSGGSRSSFGGGGHRSGGSSGMSRGGHGGGGSRGGSRGGGSRGGGGGRRR